MYDAGVVGDKHHHFFFVFPALAAVRTPYAPLFALKSVTLRAVVWQPDLLMVVWYVYECFQVRVDLDSVCWCPIGSASSGWADVMMLIFVIVHW
jgi:hypothetical protein